MHVIHRKTCRVCGSSSLTEVIDLGDQYLQGSFIKSGQRMPPQRKIPTQLMRCDPTKDENACGLLQLSKTLPPEILYSVYWYRSGTNQTMRDHLKGIADDASNICEKEDALVLDIGCNDGTLLSFYPPTFNKYGVDPSDIAQTINDEVVVIQDLFPSGELMKRVEGEKFDIITSIAMFYDLEDPVKFVRQIKDVLALDGLWVFEMSYMPSMLDMCSYDTICHEHLEYYSLAVLEFILKQADMHIFKIKLNSINGGSIRCYATHSDNYKYKNPEDSSEISDLRQTEFDMALDTDAPYKDFQERINIHKHELTTLIKKLKADNKKIHIYGASTKGNTILQFCGLDHGTIDYASERNPDKFGAKTLGTNIPIISEEESRAMNPDYYLVLPWHFKEEFISREKAMLDRGVGMIFPLPKVDIITSST